MRNVAKLFCGIVLGYLVACLLAWPFLVRAMTDDIYFQTAAANYNHECEFLTCLLLVGPLGATLGGVITFVTSLRKEKRIHD